VRKRFDEADGAILTEYRGLKVKELADLRRTLRASGGEYKIYKNTLVRFAARDAGIGALDALLKGPTAVTFVRGDAAAVAKALRDYGRTNQLLVIKGGVLGDKVLDAQQTTALAELPSRDVLLARIAGGLAAPLQQLAGLLQALPRNLAYGLAALRDQKAEAGGLDAPEAAVPEAAVPEAAVPQDAAPESAEADPTESDPTESDPTESDPTESDPTESDPTESDPSAPTAE
jgi:large subunit ribosomal protein L10